MKNHWTIFGRTKLGVDKVLAESNHPQASNFLWPYKLNFLGTKLWGILKWKVSAEVWNLNLCNLCQRVTELPVQGVPQREGAGDLLPAAGQHAVPLRDGGALQTGGRRKTTPDSVDWVHPLCSKGSVYLAVFVAFIHKANASAYYISREIEENRNTSAISTSISIVSEFLSSDCYLSPPNAPRNPRQVASVFSWCFLLGPVICRG